MENKKLVFKDFLKKEPIIAAVVGLIVGVLITFLVGVLLKSTGVAKLRYGKDVLAVVNGKEVSTNDLYKRAKISAGLEYTVDAIDTLIVDDMYTLSAKDEKDVKEQADYLLKYYTYNYGYTEEEFLNANGFKTYDEFLNNVKLNVKINKYLADYLEKKLEEGAVQKYYDENKADLESYDTEHILVKTSDTVTDEQALELANEIIAKLDEGKSFSEVVEEYGDKIVHEELGYQPATASLEQTYLDEMVALEDGAYSKTPVKTSYGYHIVHKLATSTFEDARTTVIFKLAENITSEDSGIYNRALIELRKSKNLVIYDEDINEQYQRFCDSVPKEKVEENQEEMLDENQAQNQE